jgi:hypothetical protein
MLALPSPETIAISALDQHAYGLFIHYECSSALIATVL